MDYSQYQAWGVDPAIIQAIAARHRPKYLGPTQHIEKTYSNFEGPLPAPGRDIPMEDPSWVPQPPRGLTRHGEVGVPGPSPLSRVDRFMASYFPGPHRPIPPQQSAREQALLNYMDQVGAIIQRTRGKRRYGRR